MANFILQTKVKISDIETVELPVIFVNGQSVLQSFCLYLKQNRRKSNSWLYQSSLALRLLLDYAEIHENTFRYPQELFAEFSEALFTGTVDQNGYDPTTLRWKPKSVSNANSLIQHVTSYSDWLYDKTGNESQLLNPKKKANKYERICNLAAYHQRKHRAFLQHTWSDVSKNNHIQLSRQIASRKVLSDNLPVKEFPTKVAIELFSNGFRNNKQNDFSHEQVNLKNILITMLLHYGGLRVSEPFHIFIEDIYTEPDNSDMPLIKISHPILGEAPKSWRVSHSTRKNDNRQTYLFAKYGIKDRSTDRSASYHAGWKSNTYKSFYVYFFPPSVGITWLKLFKFYLKFQRNYNPDYPHPFAFTSRDGRPASIKSYVKSHSNALKKLGYIPHKNNGLSPHGHRHWYGNTLRELNVSPLIIKKAMHHSSIESQKIYTAETKDGEIARALRKAEFTSTSQNLKTNLPFPLGFEDVDPLGLFNGL